MTPTAIDMHSHYYGGLVDDLLLRHDRPNVSRGASGQLVLNAMTASTDMSDGYTDLDARLAYMDASGITTQLLTFPGALGVDVMPMAQVGEAMLNYNSHLAGTCRASSSRFAGLGELPLAGMEACAMLWITGIDQRDAGQTGSIAGW